MNSETRQIKQAQCPPSRPSAAAISYLTIAILTDTLLESLDLQSNHSRPVSAQSKITSEEPETRMSSLAPHGSDLALFIESPNILDLVGQLVTKDVSSLRSHVLVAGGEDDLVCWKFGTICEFQAVGLDFCDFLALLDLDFAVDN